MKINSIYREYTTEDKVLPYSIDESILDVTDTWEFFGDSPQALARKIQKRVRNETGIYLSVGIGDSPVLAKIALDIEAKKVHNLMATWHYEDVPEKLWPITELTDIWSIGRRTAKKLNDMGIYSEC